jgi:hypothetical protein
MACQPLLCTNPATEPAETFDAATSTKETT